MLNRAWLVLFVTLVIVGCQTAPHTSGRVTVHGDDVSASIMFNDHDRRYIHDYYARYKHKKLPPGLAKREQLPPGLAKRDRLPPGLEGRGLPDDLERYLSRLPDNYVRLKVGRDIVLMDRLTRVVFDVIYAVD